MSGVVEDEKHMMLDCKAYELERGVVQAYWRGGIKIRSLCSGARGMSDFVFCWVMEGRI